MGFNKDKSPSMEAAELRRLAEERLLARRAEFQHPRTEEELQRLVHELEVHQIELEMQNAELHQTRDDLKKALDKYTDLYDLAPVAYFTLDHEGVVHSVNLGGASLLGMERSMLSGRLFGLLVTVEERAAFADFLGKVFANEGKESCEVTLLGPGNQPLFAQIEAVADATGQECCLAVIDITGRKQTETALQAAEQKLRSIVEHSTNLFYIHSSDHILTYVSPQSRQFFDCEPEEALMRWTKFITDNPVNQAAIDATQRAIATGERQPPYQVECIGRTGRKLWVEVNEAPVVENGKTVAVVGSLTDITERKRAEESLRFSEERFRALFRDNPAMIVTLDGDGTMLSVNPTCAVQLGYSIDELEGRSVLMLFLEDDRHAVIEQLHKCQQNPGQVYRWQLRKLNRDGGMLWVEETAQAIYDLNGSLNLLIVCQDITERKKAEAEREKLLLQLDAVLNSINEGVVISDLSGNILLMNSSALAFHEYTSVEQVRQHLHQLLDIFEVSDLEGRTVPFEQWPLSRVLRREQITDIELRVNRKDKGSSRIGSYSGTPVQIRSSDVILAVITVRDITERKQAEAEIQRLASFPLLNPNPVLELDADGNLTFCNPAAKQILEKGGYGANINPLLPQDMSEILQDLRNNKSGQFLREIEINGRYFEELVFITPQSHAVRIYSMEITGRKRAEEKIEILNTDLAARAVELEDANRELEAFNYTVAHDLRNPLNVVSCYCQAIKQLCGDRLDEPCKNYLQEAYNGIHRMNRLIESLLQFSRMAHVGLKRDRVNLSSMAGEIAGELMLTGPERRVNFRLAEGINADGDANLLRVVLTNLLGNAWKYTATQEEAIIEFTLAEFDGRPVFFIRDNGPGFDMKDGDKLFVPFKRLPGVEECRGFGIGLATVERIIRRHGGRVWAEGELGKGATFYFTLQS